MSYSRILRLLTALLFLTSSLGNPLVAEDLLASPGDQAPARQKFPLAVKLLGFTQTPNSIAVLIQIGSETRILRQGVEKTVLIDGVPDVNRLMFESIEFDERSILLGFPKSPYRSRVCRMKDE